jgi:hypothetical protein
MKKILLFAALTLAIVEGVAATKPSQHIITNETAQEERLVSGFTGVSSGGYFNVYITLADKESLRLEGDAEMLKDIETYVEKGVLKIQLKSKKRYWDWNSSDRKKVNVYINAKVLTNVAISGSGSIKIEGTVKAPDFKAVVSGSGNLSVTAESVNFNGTISGSGAINLAGNAQNTDMTVSGSGSLQAQNFKSKSANIAISGSGNATLGVDKSLKGTISGSGSIRYKGNPEVTETRSGSGRISRI